MATIGAEAAKMVVKLRLPRSRLDLHLGHVAGDGLIEDEVDVGHVIAKQAVPAPAAAGEEEVDKGLELLPIWW